MFTLKNLTLPQALVFIACVGATVAAYKLLASSEAAAVVGMVGMVLSFLMGRGDPPPSPPPDPPASSEGPKSGSIGFLTPLACLAFALAGCKAFEANDPTDALAKCAHEAHMAFDNGANVGDAMKTFEDCKKREGL